MAPISPSLGTPLHDMVSEALGPKESISSGQLLLIFGGYNTIGEEFGANSTFVRFTQPFGNYKRIEDKIRANSTFMIALAIESTAGHTERTASSHSACLTLSAG
jgi:hypothetical protein